MMVFLSERGYHWFPQLLIYSSRTNDYPLFLRASQKRHFVKLAQITGVSDPKELGDKVMYGIQRAEANRWRDFIFSSSFEDRFNLKNWATLT